MSKYNSAPNHLILAAMEAQESITIVDCDDYTDVLASFHGYDARQQATEWLDLDRAAKKYTYEYNLD